MTDSYETRHQQHDVYIGKLATHLLNEYSYPSLEDAYKAARMILLDADEITSLTKLNKIVAEVTASVKPISTAAWDEITSELGETAIYEAEFYKDMFDETNRTELAAAAEAKVLSQAANSLMTLTSGQSVMSDTWSNYVKANANSVVSTYAAQIRAGYSNNETASQITKRLKNVTSGILKRNAEALVRTGMNHYANSARDTVMQANKDIVKRKYYNAVFDNITTLICRANSTSSKNPWDIDDKTAPSLPAHMGCRGNWLYLVGDQTRPYGTRAAVGGQKCDKAAELYEEKKRKLRTKSKVTYTGRKDSNIFKAGQISGKTDMDKWMLNQPKWFVESALGKGRAELFMTGKVSLANFTDATSKPISLADLKAKYL